MSDPGRGVPLGPWLDPGCSTPELASIWSPAARVIAMLEVEAALAHSTAGDGDATALGEIDAELERRREYHRQSAPAADTEAQELLARGWTDGSPVITLLSDVRSRLGTAAGELLHGAATTQDIVDSAVMLQMQRTRRIVVASARACVDLLEGIAADAGDQEIAGRTLLQPAMTMTLAHRVRSWARPLAIAADRWEGLSCPVQLGGAVGTTVLPIDGLAVHLGLDKATPWHTDRSPIVSHVVAAQRLAAACEKVAVDVILLAQPEIGEVTVRAGGSSAMPGKRNPIDAVRCRAAARVCAATAGAVIALPAHELERAAGSWQAEWTLVPLALHAAGATVEALTDIVSNLRFPDPPGRRSAVGRLVAAERPGSAGVRVRTSDGAALHVVVAGTHDPPTSAATPPVVLLHSLGTDHHMWDPQADALAGSRRIIRPDMRGHGGSEVPFGDVTIERLGTDVVEIVEHLGLAEYDLVGLSIGGLIAQWVAAHRPAGLRRLVLCNTGARIGTAELWNDRAAAVRAGGVGDVAEAVLARWFSPAFTASNPSAIDRARVTLLATPTNGYAACCTALAAADLRGEIGRIQVPTLVLAGDLDLATPASDAEIIRAAVQDSELHVMPGVAHIASFEAADVVSAALFEFLG